MCVVSIISANSASCGPFDSDPNTRGALGEGRSVASKTTKPADCTAQCLLDLVNRLRPLLANELQSHMQRFRPNPPRVRSESANAFRERLNPLSDPVVNVESNEESHSRSKPNVLTSV
jgi:hypothetical protein